MKITSLPYLCLLLLLSSIVHAQNTHLKKNVVYGHRDGMAMVYDVETPDDPNGRGIIFLVSGGWHSGQENLDIAKPFWQILLKQGYTLFHLYHPSMPTYKIPDAYEASKAGLNHILKNAQTFGVDPDRLGMTGISSGGHLSLLLAMDAEAQNDSDGRSVAAVVAFMPVIDLRDFVGNVRATPALDFDPALAPALSPIDHVSADEPPIMMIHGANDTVAPYADSVRLHEALKNVGATTNLVTVEAGHEVYPEPEMTTAHNAMLSWFEDHL